jgi:hypothetical protein
VKGQNTDVRKAKSCCACFLVGTQDRARQEAIVRAIAYFASGTHHAIRFAKSR